MHKGMRTGRVATKRYPSAPSRGTSMNPPRSYLIRVSETSRLWRFHSSRAPSYLEWWLVVQSKSCWKRAVVWQLSEVWARFDDYVCVNGTRGDALCSASSLSQQAWLPTAALDSLHVIVLPHYTGTRERRLESGNGEFVKQLLRNQWVTVGADIAPTCARAAAVHPAQLGSSTRMLRHCLRKSLPSIAALPFHRRCERAVTTRRHHTRMAAPLRLRPHPRSSPQTSRRTFRSSDPAT